jgi:hypothetical protein
LHVRSFRLLILPVLCILLATRAFLESGFDPTSGSEPVERDSSPGEIIDAVPLRVGSCQRGPIARSGVDDEASEGERPVSEGA